jgi:S1-C subfamily serine protease
VWFNQDEAGYSVVNVTKGGPSDQAGLKVDDQIVAVDGKPATSVPVYALREHLRNEAPGTVIHFTVKRGGETKDVLVTLKDLI